MPGSLLRILCLVLKNHNEDTEAQSVLGMDWETANGVLNSHWAWSLEGKKHT